MRPEFTHRWILAVLVVGAVLWSAAGDCADAQSTGETRVAHAGIAGTLLRPAGTTTAGLIIPGSGPIDRDGNSLSFKTNTYKYLAEGLAKANIASLRYDKRGLPESRRDAKGEAVKEERITIQTSADDAVSLAIWLHMQGFRRIVLIGHSEGVLLALLAAKTANADRLVLLNPPGYPLGQVLRKQFSRQPLPEDIQFEIERVLTDLERGSDPGTIKTPVDRLFRPSVQPFLKSVLTLDPVALLKGLSNPVLLVGGGNDLQVGRLDVEELRAARADVRLHWEPRLTHMLKAVIDDDPRQTKMYGDPDVPIMPELIAAIVAFASEP